MNTQKSPVLFFRRALQTLAAIFVVSVFAAAVLAFVIPLFASFFQKGASFSSSSQNLKLAKIAVFTLQQALLSTLIALVVGLLASSFVTHRNFFLRRLLLSTAAVPLCIPPLIVALGYVGFFGMNGSANRAISALLKTDKKAITFLYSFWGIVIAQGFYNFPLVMATVSDAWSTLPRTQSDAAKMLGASKMRIFFSITIRQLMPSIVSACIPVFLYCFFSFLIVLLFGGVGTTTLEVELYHQARNSLDLTSASKIALVETLMASIAVALYSSLERKSAMRKTESTPSARRKSIKGKERIGAIIVFSLIIIFFVCPLLCIIFASFPKGSLVVMKKLVSKKGFVAACSQTIKTGVSTAFFSTCAALVCALFLKASKKQNIAMKTFPMLPMAVSSVVMGFGMTAVVRTGTKEALIAAQTALTWPLAFRQIWAGFSRISDESADAARLLSPRPLDTAFEIYVKGSKRNILSALVLCFAVSAGDATLPLVLAIPHFDTLSLFTYRLASSYRFSEACASGLILGAFCMILFAFANKMKETK